MQVASVARLAETVRDSSDGMRRLEHIGVDLPPSDDWEGWEAWRWLDFTHVLLDEEEWKERRRYKKDKGREREELAVYSDQQGEARRSVGSDSEEESEEEESEEEEVEGTEVGLEEEPAAQARPTDRNRRIVLRNLSRS